MASNAVYDSVSLDQIDERDHHYKISTGGPSGPLVASIERVGILTPPVLIPKKDTTWSIVSGFKRIAALKRIGVRETIACMLDRKTDPIRCIEIAVIDNSIHRSLNPVEQGRAVLLLDSVYSDDVSLCRAADALGVPVNASAAQKLRFAAQMIPCLQNALINGQVALPVALQLSDMKELSDIEQLIELIDVMGLGLNRQREMLDWLKAISRREGISLTTLLEDVEIKRVVENHDMDHKQKSRLLRGYFRQRRYPEMVETETRFKDMVKSLKLGNGIRLVPPQHFEGQVFNLTVQFSDHQELISRYQRLNIPVNSSTMAALWDIFRKP